MEIIATCYLLYMKATLLFSLIIACLLALTSCKSTQPVVQQSESPSTLSTTSWSLLAKAPGDSISQPLGLQNASVHIDFHGPVAQTTLDLTFYNQADRELEGSFFLPMLSGQVIDSFALKVEGQLRYAVIVTPEKGRTAYEETVARKIDPALLEWTQGGNFKMRVYPIPAKGSKRIRVVFHRPLDFQPDFWTYRLPFAFPDTLKELQLELTVDGQRKPTLEHQLSAAAPITEPEWNRTLRGLEARIDLQNATSLGDIMVRVPLPRADQAQTPTYVYEDQDGEAWFASWVYPEAIKIGDPTAPPYRRIGLLWDISHSASRRNLEAEITYLRRFLSQWTSIEVRVIPFHQQIGTIESFRIADGDISELEARLRDLACDGATRLEHLDLDLYNCDAYFLSSDGLPTWGEKRIPLGENPPPVHVLASYLPNNDHYLSQLAQRTGGSMIEIQTGNTEPILFPELHFQIRTVETEGISQLASPQNVGGGLLLTGKLEGQKGGIFLEVTQGNRPAQSLVVELARQKDLVPTPLPQRLFAQQFLNDLMLDASVSQDSIAAVAKRYQLLSPYTSMLVLDRLEDYLTYEVMPPDGPLQREYLRKLADLKQNQKLELLTHLDLVAEGFQERIDWWKRMFEIPPGQFEEDPFKKEAAEETVEGEGFGDEPTSSLADLSPVSVEETTGPTRESRESEVEIRLTPWEPDMPYMLELQQATQQTFWATYLGLKRRFGDRPSFYLDAANIGFEKGLNQMAYRILSNLAELQPGEASMLRVLGYRLTELDSLSDAEMILRKVLKLRPEEPQSHRDLALCLASQGKNQAAVERLYEVVTTEWSGNYPEIGVMAAHELNSLAHQHPGYVDLSFVDPRFKAKLPTDLRVVLKWDSRAVDLDLWVTDPRGEKCYYQNQLTTIGALMSADFTEGYGPEEFLLKEAMPGTYLIQANYYANKQASLTGPATLEVRLIRNYGRPDQEEETMILRLSQENEVVEIGSFEVR